MLRAHLLLFISIGTLVLISAPKASQAANAGMCNYQDWVSFAPGFGSVIEIQQIAACNAQITDCVNTAKQFCENANGRFIMGAGVACNCDMTYNPDDSGTAFCWGDQDVGCIYAASTTPVD